MDTKKERAQKRPYERPTLVPSSVFGAEAMSGSCCRSDLSCQNSARDSQRLSIDPSKNRGSTAS